MNIDQALTELHTVLRFKRLKPLWAKAEILLGLLAAAVGLFLVVPMSAAPFSLSAHGTSALAGLVLFVLGCYLTLAGHRSHLYHSQSLLTAYLVTRLGAARPDGGQAPPVRV
jgi:hypothetical protein